MHARLPTHDPTDNFKPGSCCQIIGIVARLGMAKLGQRASSFFGLELTIAPKVLEGS